MDGKPEHSAGTGRSSDIKSVQRALSLLTAFNPQESELSVTELARRLRTHKSTASRMLATLESQGFVRQDPATSKYSLGFRILELATSIVTRLDLSQLARPILIELGNRCQETVNLAVFDRHEAVNVDQVLSSHAIQYIGWVGRRTPAHCSATGKVLLAHQPPDVIDRILAGDLPRYTSKTITDPQPLREELARIRERGYGVADEEFEEGLVAVATAICGLDSVAIAAVSISAPSFRVSDERRAEFAGLTRQAADEIGRRLGHTSLLAPGSHSLASDGRRGSIRTDDSKPTADDGDPGPSHAQGAAQQGQEL